MAAAITAKISVGSMVLLCHTGKETMVFLICEEWQRKNDKDGI